MKTNKGFTLIELMIVIIVFVLINAIALPNMVSSRESANFQVCVRNRQTIEQAEGQYVLDHDKHSTGTLADLIDGGYIDASIRCPSGGIYYWVTYLSTDNRYRTVVGCSMHGEDKTINANVRQAAEEDGNGNGNGNGRGNGGGAPPPGRTDQP